MPMLPNPSGLVRRAFSLLGMKILLVSNRSSLLADDEFFLGRGGHLHSLLSNFHTLQEIAPGSDAGLVFTLLDDPDSGFGFAQTHPGRYWIFGPLARLEAECPDKRQCIFGNMSLFSKILVRELESRGIYSLHSTAFFDPRKRRLYLIPGGSGSGKSTVLLKAIALGGIEVFGTELTHFQSVQGRTRMLKGALWQNCRMGNLVFDFPELLARFGLERPEGDPWHSYQSVPLMDLQTPFDEFEPESLDLILPRIEGERVHASIRTLPVQSLAGRIFQDLSDKVSPPTLLWGTHFVPGIDTSESQSARMEAARRFLRETKIGACWSVLASPATCLDGIYPGFDIEYSTTQEVFHV